MKRLTAFLFLIALAAPGAASAQETDPHAIYEQSCARCHEAHAGDFVHNRLELKADRLVSTSSGKDIEVFLSGGHGRLEPAERQILLDQLIAIRQSGQLFHDKCLTCHDRAVEFARSRLIVKDGVLVGRYSGKNTGQFLQGHGRLTPDEADRMFDVLKRQLQVPAN
ncbi:hypothetical protein [uncultured Roseibium sp.]|uniref:hypothetical protein n=1 Tax=uncultured Roseibium sp. TaxID=1936171 RepID=UPI0032170AB7